MARPAVDFRFNFTGGALFEKLTQFNLPQNNQYNHLAIILDDFVQSAPRIQSTISDRGQITGDFTQEEVDDLAGDPHRRRFAGLARSRPAQRAGRQRHARRRHDRAGVTSMLVATRVVVVFMLIYYRFAGLVANIALILNVLLTVAFMIMFNAAFTLSGLAGLGADRRYGGRRQRAHLRADAGRTESRGDAPHGHSQRLRSRQRSRSSTPT